MTAAELQLWRARIGWTRPFAAKEIGVELGTFDAWIYGRYKIPEPVARLCKMLEDVKESPRQSPGSRQTPP